MVALQFTDGGLKFFATCRKVGVAAEFDAAVAAEAGGVHELEHAVIVERELLALVVPHAVFHRHTLGKRQQLLHPAIGIIALARLDAEVAEVRQGAAAFVVDLLNHLHQPVGVAREAAVVFHDHIQPHLRPDRREPAETVGRQLHLLVPRATAAGIHADGMAPEKLGCIEPLAVVVHRLLALGRIRIAYVALAIAHDQQALYALIGRALFHFAEIIRVLRLVHEELVHVLHCVDAVFRGDLGEIEIINLARAQLPIDRPLRERNLQLRRILRPSRTRCQSTDRQAGLRQKLSSRNIVEKLHAPTLRPHPLNSIAKGTQRRWKRRA